MEHDARHIVDMSSHGVDLSNRVTLVQQRCTDSSESPPPRLWCRSSSTSSPACHQLPKRSKGGWDGKLPSSLHDRDPPAHTCRPWKSQRSAQDGRLCLLRRSAVITTFELTWSQHRSFRKGQERGNLSAPESKMSCHSTLRILLHRCFCTCSML